MTLPVTQRPPSAADLIDLSWGHPAEYLLPGEAWAGAYAAAVRRYGADALGYGYASGPGPLIEWLAVRLGQIDGRAPGTGEVFVTAGASQALELLCATLLRPGDAVLVQSPTYHLALRIIADHGVRLVPVPDEPGAIEGIAGRLRAGGYRVPLLYLVPTYTNPTGRTMPEPVRRELLAVAAAAGVLILEDDTYRELGYDEPPPPSIYALAPAALQTGTQTGQVVRVGSFSKTVAPGLRLGWLTGSPGLVGRLADRGMLDSGGGVNHATALAMAEFGSSGAYDRHLVEIRQAYRGQRDAMVGALRERLPGLLTHEPHGGWFCWLRAPDGVPSAELATRAGAAGVSYVDGARFKIRNGGEAAMRLSYSLWPEPILTEGVARLAGALHRF